MDVVLLSRDLMLLARVEGAARKLGLTMVNANSANDCIELAGNQAAKAIVIDLRLPALEIGNLVSQLREVGGEKLLIIACGPHVQEANLTAAREAGCDVVATRGQFERDAETILNRCLAAYKA